MTDVFSKENIWPPSSHDTVRFSTPRNQEHFAPSQIASAASQMSSPPSKDFGSRSFLYTGNGARPYIPQTDLSASYIDESEILKNLLHNDKNQSEVAKRLLTADNAKADESR